MYTVILATALSMGGQTPTWHHGCYGCGCYGGCWGCYGGGCWGGGCWGGYGGGCWGGYGGGYGCWGCYGGGYSYGCWGCYGGGWGGYGCSCYGCYGGSYISLGCSCYGCYGCSCYGCSCYGGCGGYAIASPVYSGGVVASAPAVTAPASGGAAPLSNDELDALRRLLRARLDKEKASAPAGNTDNMRTAAVAKESAPARITVKLPEDARLWVDNVECPLKSDTRAFNTPPLERGRSYYYTLRIQTRGSDGQPTNDSQRVTIAAGSRVEVNFTTAAQTAQR